MTQSQPIKTGYPRFARLLYLDGTIKLFGVPRVIMDLFINKDASSSGGMASYSKKGMRWSFGFSSRTPDPKHLAGAYEIVGDELVKRDQTGGVGFDGCKEFDSEEAFFSKKRNYFYIDICKGE